MAFRFVCHGRGPMEFLQHLRNGHASLFKPASSNLFLSKSFTNKPLTVREWVTRSASEESAPVEPVEADIPGIQEAVAVENAFAQLGVDDRLLSGLERAGISAPTDVQIASIPEILTTSNVAMQCYTGSGKTLAFLLPVLSMAIQRAEDEWAGVTRKTRGQVGAVQAIIVTPSRELAMQIVRVAESILPESARKAVQQCIGGANMLRQRENLKMFKPLLVVGTPGRLAELSRDGALQTHRCGILVLDEADQLLAPQFREEMMRITEHTGKKCDTARQTIIVSATLTPRVLSLCEVWCPQPKAIFVGAVPSENAPGQEEAEEGEAAFGSGTNPKGAQWGWTTPGFSSYAPEMAPGTGSAGGYGNRDTAPSIAPGLTHLYVTTSPQHRVDTLRRAIHATNAQRALVFMNFQQRLQDAAGKLAARKMKVACLHGELSKQERQNTLAAFKAGKYRALLVSDVAARGLDVPDCDAVFNLELPTDAAHYAHRAGRTGRAGKEGLVVTVASAGETFVVEKLGRRLGVEFTEIKLEGGDAMVLESSNLEWLDDGEERENEFPDDDDDEDGGGGGGGCAAAGGRRRSSYSSSGGSGSRMRQQRY